MKLHIIFLISLVSFGLYGQEDQGFEIPNFAAKTPEAAAFLKYGEYPVDLSTGLPNISIPLYTAEIKDFQLPITLNYHSSGIKVDQEATWVGLGWNVSYGAQIILSVRDGIDENNQYIDNIPSDESIAYYNNNSHPYAYNDGPLVNENFDQSRVKDIYQFSSPTVSGQFYIRNAATNDIVVFPPDAFKVDGINLSESVIGGRDRFRIIDKQGNVYLFKSTFEISSRSMTHSDTYKSAWFVDEIRTPNNQSIAFAYEDDGTLNEYDFTHYYNVKTNQPDCGCSADATQYTVSGLLNRGGTTSTSAKKIKYITFNAGLSRINFVRTIGRQDLLNSNSNGYLDELRIEHKDNNNIFQFVKGIDLVYSYFNPTYNGADAYKYKRLKLEKIKTLITEETHSFEYSSIEMPIKTSYGKDYYGYYNGANNNMLIPQHYVSAPWNVTVGNSNREVNDTKNQMGILKKIIYPTKGYSVFNYETNDYYAPNEVQSNTLTKYGSVIGVGSGGPNVQGDTDIVPVPGDLYVTQCPSCVQYSKIPFTYSNATNSKINVSITNSVNNDPTLIHGQYGRIRVFLNTQTTAIYDSAKKTNLVTDINLSVLNNAAVSGYVVLEAWGGNIAVNATLNYTLAGNPETKIKGAGLRINSIEGYDFNAQLQTKKIYSYTDPINISRSSGRPVNYLAKTFISSTNKNFSLSICPSTGGVGAYAKTNYSFVYTISSNSISGIEGNTVVYDYVKESSINVISNSSDGYTLYKFKNEPDDILGNGVQIYRSWKRGQLLEKTTYKSLANGSNIPLTKEINNYQEDTSKISKIVGFKFNRLSRVNTTQNPNDPFEKPWGVANGSDCFVPQTVLEAVEFLKYSINIPWQYLKSTEITENFYNTSNSLLNTVITTKTYNYNNSNHLQLSSEVTTSSMGESVEYKYFYPGDSEVASEPVVDGLITKNILKPIKVQSFKAGNKLSERKTVYRNWGTTTSPLYLPELIQGSKGTGNLETRIRFLEVDTSNGNILRLKQENGIELTYIWGYGGIYPIAKLENTTGSFASTASALGTTASALKIMTAAPANIRSVFPNVMVNSYTYTPLKGVSSVKDPTEYITSYEYDAFGRLTAVRDANGNIISENKYNYKP